MAQLEQLAQVEIPTNPEKEEEHLIFTLKENGVLLLHTEEDILHHKIKLEFTKLDSTLQNVWKNELVLNDEFNIEQFFYNEDFFYLLFSANKSTNIRVSRINLHTGEEIYTDGNLLAEMDIEHFSVLGNKAIIGGKYNDRPVVTLFNFFDNQSIVLPELHANHYFINSILVNEVYKNIYILLRNERNCQFILKTYSYQGKLEKTETIGEKGKVPVLGDILSKKDGSLMLVGNYSENCSEASIGLYFHDLNAVSPKTRFINFADLDNFFKFMSEKKEKRIKTRIDNQKQKGKEIKLRYKLLLHDIISTENGWALLAEIYYPEYKSTQNTGYYTSSLRNYRLGQEVYNNFVYTHALICGFDDNGTLTWNNSVSLEGLESKELDKKVQVSSVGNDLLLAYPYNNFIKTELIKQNDPTKYSEKYPLSNAKDKSVNLTEKPTNLTAWYGRNFILYGYKNIKPDNAILPKEVFFISKMRYILK